MLLTYMHLNNYLFNFVRSWFWIKFRCTWYSTIPKFCKLLSGEIYRRQLFDKNGQLLYPANCEMPSSNNQSRSTTITNELNIFYDTPVVCGFSKCKGLNKNCQCVTLSHYINDQLPKVDDLIPPTTIKNPKGI